MGDESGKCRACGATLEGRDVYEGICKTCREEAILGSPAPQPRQKQKEPQPPSPPPPQRTPPADAIAIEVSVDLDADTKEIALEDDAAPPAGAATAPSEAAALPPPGPCEAPEGSQLPPPLNATEAAPPRDETPAAGGPPALEFETLEAPAPAPAAHPVQDATSARSLREAPTLSTGTPEAEPVARNGLPPPAQRPQPTIKRLPHAEQPETELVEPVPLLRIAPRAPQPQLRPPALPSEESHKPLALATEAEGEQSPAPAAPQQERELDLPALEADSHHRQARRRIAPPEPAPEKAPPRIAPPRPAPAEAAGPASRGRGEPRLDTDAPAGNLRGLLDEMQAQVEQLSRVLSTAHKAAPSAFWFGFRASFGFVLGMAVLAAVVVGLMALIGVLFYRPAFELVQGLFGHLGLP